MKVLFHVATDINNEPVDAVFVDGNGKKYVVQCETPTEIESDFMADKIAEHCRHYGIVVVEQVRTGKGVDWNLEKAYQDAAAALELAEKSCINEYIRTQLESRVKQNYPPLPPEGRALDCVIKHQYNLKRAGLHIVGWEPPYDMPGGDEDQLTSVSPELEQRMKALENENNELRKTLMQFMQTMMVQQTKASKDKGKGKQQQEEQEDGVQTSTV